MSHNRLCILYEPICECGKRKGKGESEGENKTVSGDMMEVALGDFYRNNSCGVR